jgi:hypothetical protein
LSTIQNNFFYSCNGLRYINIGNVDWSNINPNASNAFNSVTNISSNVIFGQYANEFKSKFSNINNWTAITQ